MSTDVMDFSDFDKDENLDAFELLAPGQYHVIVDEVDATRQRFSGIQLKLRVLAGNVAGQVGKHVNPIFNDPKSDHKDGGKFAKKMLAKLALETGLVTREQFGQPNVTIDWNHLKGRQLCVVVKNKEPNADGKIFSELDGMNFGSPLDPKYDHIQKDESAIAYLRAAAGQAAAPQPTAQAVPVATSPVPTGDAFSALGL
jgi:hypothetical protein